jgi:hypothetical protein
MNRPSFGLIGFSLLLSIETFSQTEPVSLINSQQKLDRSFFICPEIKYSKVIGEWEYLAGIRIGYCIDHKYVFGLGAEGMISDNGFFGVGTAIDSNDVYIRNGMYYGGLYFDYIIPTGLPLQVSFPTLIGAGGNFLFQKFDDMKQPDAEILEMGDFLFAEPKINLELNISRVFRLGMGVGYRIVINSHLDRLDNSDLSGIVLNVNIKFGGF